MNSFNCFKRSHVLCFEDLLTVEGVTYGSFKSVCKALGLLSDDREGKNELNEAFEYANSNQIRHLFVIILLFCEVSDSVSLFEKTWELMSDDIIYKIRE